MTMKKVNHNLMVPKDKKYGAVRYYAPKSLEKNPNIIFEPNKIFSMKLKIGYASQGASTCSIHLIDGHNNVYWMFIDEFMYAIKNADVINGVITGDWAFRKQGANLSLVLATKERL